MIEEIKKILMSTFFLRIVRRDEIDKIAHQIDALYQKKIYQAIRATTDAVESTCQALHQKELRDIFSYHCKECSTPGFVHLVIPVKVASKYKGE